MTALEAKAHPPQDPFARFSFLNVVACDRDDLARAHQLELPENNQKRARCVEQLVVITANPTLGFTFHVTRCVLACKDRTDRSAKSVWDMLSEPLSRVCTRSNDDCRPLDYPLTDEQAASSAVTALITGLGELVTAHDTLFDAPLKHLRKDGFDAKLNWPDEVQAAIRGFVLGDMDDSLLWPEAPRSWHDVMEAIENDSMLTYALGKSAKRYFQDPRAEELVSKTHEKLVALVLCNADRWYAQHMGLAGPLKQVRRKPRPTEKQHGSKEKTWRGWLLVNYPTIMKRQADYIIGPPGSAPQKPLRDNDDAVRDPSPGAPQRASQNELDRAVCEALAGLSSLERAVVVLKIFDELSRAKIAEILELPDSRVHSILRHALKRLRHGLGGWGSAE